MLAPSVVDRWGEHPGCQHVTDVGNCLNDALPERIIQDDFAPAP
jgi:hypothetical protein